ncbi:hypothetical protein BX600DRAFT_464298 [Xylariales sp. PMI_506]|nr:hypothetical protein BX600DRAFT_464298 [Xylariales sp. PMI_506]
MYRTIFPSDSTVPTCCYDDTDLELHGQSDVDMLERYCRFVKQELPSLVLRELGASTQPDLLETFCRRLPTLLQTLNHRLFETFQSSQEALLSKPGCPEEDVQQSLHSTSSRPPVFLGDFDLPPEILSIDGWPNIDYNTAVPLDSTTASETIPDFGHNSLEWIGLVR